MTRLEWKMLRHRERTMTHFWESSTAAQYSTRPGVRQHPRCRPNLPMPILVRWHYDYDGEFSDEARIRAVRDIMRTNVMPFRFW